MRFGKPRLLAVAAVALCAFGVVATVVVCGGSAALDRRIILALRSAADPGRLPGPAWLREMLRDLTALGSTVVLWLILLLATLHLALSRKWNDIRLLVAACAGAQIASSLLKIGFGRARPDLVPNAPQVFTASFPSGHALLSAAVYLSLGALLARGEPSRSLQRFYLGVGVFLTLAIGASRVALGVHWPTDVLGGWCLGVCWVALCFAALSSPVSAVTVPRA